MKIAFDSTNETGSPVLHLVKPDVKILRINCWKMAWILIYVHKNDQPIVIGTHMTQVYFLNTRLHFLTCL